MDQEKDFTLQIEGFRSSRLIDVLLYAEKQYPGIRKDIISLQDYKGILTVSFKDVKSAPMEKIFKDAWQFLGEQKDTVEFEYSNSTNKDWIE